MALILSLAGPAAALLPDEENTIQVSRVTSPSVVFITNIEVGQNFFMDELAIPRGNGSGFVWDADGHIVTNYHVVHGGNAFLVKLEDQTEVEAKLIGAEPRKDIAVLKIVKPAAKLRPLPLGLLEAVQVGQKVIAIGNPFGLDHSISQGIVSALGRQVVGIGGVTIHDMIQTDAAINPGNSGGPLLDSAGKLIGMNTMIFSQTGANAGVGFAVPVSYIRRIVPELIKNGRVTQPGIGIVILTEEQKYRLVGGIQGVVVRSVQEGMPAAKAGIQGISADRRTGRVQLGDIIISINDKPIKDYDDLYNVLDRHRVGEKVTVQTLRAGKKRSYAIELVNV